MDAATIDAMEPGMRMQWLGNGLYPRVTTLVGESLAGKVTGMLLEMSTAELVGFLENEVALKDAVGAAVAALPPDMLDLLGESSNVAPDDATPASPDNPSPTSVMCPADESVWADADEEDDLPPVGEMLASAERKRAERSDRTGPDAMEMDDGFVCEWDFAQMEASPAEPLCAFIAERLAEPQVRIMRAVVELLGATVALGLLRDTERCVFNGGMVVEETGKPRTAGGTYLKLLKDASGLPVEAQLAALNRIKKEGADAKKAQQKALAAKRNAPRGGKAEAAPTSPDAGQRSKPMLADFMTPQMRA